MSKKTRSLETKYYGKWIFYDKQGFIITFICIEIFNLVYMITTILTPKAPKIKVVEFANRFDPDTRVFKKVLQRV